VRLKILPPPDWLEHSLSNNHIALLTDDGSLMTSQLAQSLTDQGWNVVVLSFPLSLVPNRLPLGVNRVELEDLSEAHLQQQLAAIAETYGPIAVFIHLHPIIQANSSSGICYSEINKAIVKQVFLMAKHLKSLLNASAEAGYSCFCTVTRLDGAFGLEQRVNFDAINAGLFGLTKSLNQEWSRVFCRAIDLSPHIDATHSAQHIVAELYDPDRCIAEVAYGSQGRTTLTLE
jgi:NAD(P)-dependent dehydrogenase (short-subunit alcohol dehydrogenase family)